MLRVNITTGPTEFNRNDKSIDFELLITLMKHKRNTSFTHFTTNLIIFVNSFNSCLMSLLVLYSYPHICMSFGLWVNVILFHWDQMINVSRYEDIWSWIVYRECFVVLVVLLLKIFAWLAYPYSPRLFKMSLILLTVGFAIHVSVCFQLSAYPFKCW